MSPPGCLAVLNAGSSSIKFGLYEAKTDGPLLFRGQIERIGSAAHLKVVNAAAAQESKTDPPLGPRGVRSYGPKACEYWVFGRPSQGSETVRMGSNGGEEGIRTLDTSCPRITV
jgi:hypothetical protein